MSDQDDCSEILAAAKSRLSPEQLAWAQEAGRRMAERLAAGEDIQDLMHEMVDAVSNYPPKENPPHD